MKSKKIYKKQCIARTHCFYTYDKNKKVCYDCCIDRGTNPNTIKKIKRWFNECEELEDIKVFGGGNGVVGNAMKERKFKVTRVIHRPEVLA